MSPSKKTSRPTWQAKGLPARAHLKLSGEGQRVSAPAAGGALLFSPAIRQREPHERNRAQPSNAGRSTVVCLKGQSRL